MIDKIAELVSSYGGEWTHQKLAILETYLDKFTTVLKKQNFKLIYIDAFAGTGYVELQEQDAKYFVRGSATIAAKINDKPFDKLVFVEKDPYRCAELEYLKEEHSDRHIQIENSDANEFLNNLKLDWYDWRGVLFLDPFATEVQWSTIETIASFNALDTWILFPTFAVARILPTSKKPDEISSRWADRLTTVYGDQSWRDLYRQSPQMDLFGNTEFKRNPGVDGLLSIYKNNLENLFGKRFLRKSRTLRNSSKSPLFEILFCVGNPRGIGPAKRIAKHILDHI